MNGSDAVAKTVAVLGLGEAGSLLARDLVRGGATVRGWDPDLGTPATMVTATAESLERIARQKKVPAHR